MIVLWLKIIAYKIAKEAKIAWQVWCALHSAEAGEEPSVPRACHEDGYVCSSCGQIKPTSYALRDHVLNVHPDEFCQLFHDQPCVFERRAEDYLREQHQDSTEFSVGVDPATREGLTLYSRTEDGPARATTARLRRLIELGLVSEPDGLGDTNRVEEWHREWARRASLNDPAVCPCSGKHYPSADACRWCRCHDPASVHHLNPGEITALERQLAEHPVAEIIRMSYRPCSRCGDPGHSGDRCLAKVPDSVQLDPAKLMDVRPSAEIELCPVCPHPQHRENDGRCTGSVPSWEPSGGIETCRCQGPEEDGHA